MPDQTIRLLLIEDNEIDAMQFRRMVTRNTVCEIDLQHATSMQEAIHQIEQNKFDIVLLDLGLPDSLGSESIQTLRERIPSTPILVLTGDSRPEVGLAAIEAGAQDFLPKEEATQERLMRLMIHAIVRQSKLVEAREDALLDELTGITNRRGCDATFAGQLSHLRTKGTPFSVAIFDIDHFKLVNDVGGHALGDVIIRQVGQTLDRFRRPQDHVARIGGEEFAAIFADSSIDELPNLLDPLRRAIAKLTFAELPRGITVSIGATEVAYEDDVRLAFRRADQSLYEAKNSGRDRYCIHPPERSLV